MKVIVQKVKHASCVVDNVTVSKINHGYLLLVSFTYGDSINEINKMAKKIANLRIFEDENQKLNKSIIDVKGKILSISQFTLYADPYNGNRPSFTECLRGDLANPLYEKFNEILNNEYHIETLPGVFGAEMHLITELDGPVTINLEFKEVR